MEDKILDYKDLGVWKKSHELTLNIYKATSEFPTQEQYGLTSQIRRAAYSIPMNIAEGKGSLYKKEYIRFLGIARGSACELEYQLILSRDLGYLSKENFNRLIISLREILKMLNGLIMSLKK